MGFRRALWDEGLRGNALYDAFASMIPQWKRFFDKPISDAAPVQRADKARRGGKYNRGADVRPDWGSRK
jgi:hypothetical protein